MSTEYRSGFEKKIAAYLKQNNIRFTYEHQSFEYFAPIRDAYCMECESSAIAVCRWYTPDFFLTNGVIIEAKGKFTSRDRSKILAVRDTWTDLDLRLVFMRNNKLNRSSNTRYSDWASRNGFKFHVGPNIPLDWAKERT